MARSNTENTPRWSWPAGALLLVTGLLGAPALLAGCNLLVGEQVPQCTADADCQELKNGSVCRDGVCVLDGATGGGGTGGTGGAGGTGGGEGGCFSGEPVKNEDFLNACTNAECAPFDNCARLGLCAGDSLPPLVDPPAN